MDELKALGSLISTAIDHLLTTGEITDDSPAYQPKCCNICCSTCAALKWYRDQAPTKADMATAAANRSSVFRSYWQTPSGRIDWYELNKAWARMDCPDTDDHAEILERA